MAQTALLEYYRDAYPDASVCAPGDSRGGNGNHLVLRAKFHSYLIKDGRRITPSNSPDKAPNSIIQMESDGKIFAGQVISIFQHYQFRIDWPSTLLHVRWFRQSLDVSTSEWDL